MKFIFPLLAGMAAIALIAASRPGAAPKTADGPAADHVTTKNPASAPAGN